MTFMASASKDSWKSDALQAASFQNPGSGFPSAEESRYHGSMVIGPIWSCGAVKQRQPHSLHMTAASLAALAICR
jgi:hypothetical protein